MNVIALAADRGSKLGRLAQPVGRAVPDREGRRGARAVVRGNDAPGTAEQAGQRRLRNGDLSERAEDVWSAAAAMPRDDALKTQQQIGEVRAGDAGVAMQ